MATGGWRASRPVHPGVGVCVKAKEMGQVATAEQQFVELGFGRGVLIGAPKRVDHRAIPEHATPARSDASFFVYAKKTGGKRGEIIWATYGAEVSMELSEFEKVQRQGTIGFPR